MEAWPVILQALALDAVPKCDNMVGDALEITQITSEDSLISGYDMVELKPEEYKFLLGFSLLVLFGGQDSDSSINQAHLAFAKGIIVGDSTAEEANNPSFKMYEVVLPVFQFLSSERFFISQFLTMEVCQDLFKVLKDVIPILYVRLYSCIQGSFEFSMHIYLSFC